MLIYEVSISVDPEAAGAFSKWLPEHIRKVLAVDGFVSARWFRAKALPGKPPEEADDGQASAPPKEAHRPSWIVHYELQDEASLKRYLATDAIRLREETEREFGGRFRAERRVLSQPQTVSLVPESRSMGDFPKLYCPLVRQTFPVSKDDWKKHGSRFNLRSPEAYLVVNRVNPGYEWVFEDPDTIAAEKLNGTNVKILTRNGQLIALQNRLNIIDPLQVMKGKTFILEAVFQSIGKEYVKENGEQAGEVIGPKVQGNPYKLETHEWYPFEKAVKDLQYRSFHEHERSFENWSSWFKDHLHSRYFAKRASKTGSDEKVFAEGVVFYNLRRKAEGRSWMAKLRRDMFRWYYESLDVQGYDPAGRDEVEDQGRFD